MYVSVVEPEPTWSVSVSVVRLYGSVAVLSVAVRVVNCECTLPLVSVSAMRRASGAAMPNRGSGATVIFDALPVSNDVCTTLPVRVCVDVLPSGSTFTRVSRSLPGTSSRYVVVAPSAVTRAIERVPCSVAPENVTPPPRGSVYARSCPSPSYVSLDTAPSGSVRCVTSPGVSP